MAEKEARYITTTLPYVNSDPHVGFALEIVVADALARHWHLMGHDVFFTTGTDEHGQKIATKAKEAGQDVKAYVDHYAGEFQKLKDALGLSYDNFIRTTDDAHKKAAQEIWHRCLENGDIYKKKYKGLYCVGDEMFLRESDLVDGACPNHPNMEPIEIEEENYFFALSKYQEKILAYLKNTNVIVPTWRREEAIAFVENGLEDFSISREKARLSWGVPVPDDENQVMYVWFDALTNYISTLGWGNSDEARFEKFWTNGRTLQLAGKDQVRFQSIMWQGMLMSAGIAPTDQVMYHGFITSGGQKMSKSVGNVISPFELVERYGTEATRYLLLRHVHPFEDTDITWERLDEWYTANLVNGLGNLVARIMKMVESALDNPIDVPTFSLDASLIEDMEQYNIQKYLDAVWGGLDQLQTMSIKRMDEHIQETQPFNLIKSDVADERAAGEEIIRQLVVQLYYKAQEIKPFMPETSRIILEAIEINKKPNNLFARLDK